MAGGARVDAPELILIDNLAEFLNPLQILAAPVGFNGPVDHKFHLYYNFHLGRVG